MQCSPGSHQNTKLPRSCHPLLTHLPVPFPFPNPLSTPLFLRVHIESRPCVYILSRLHRSCIRRNSFSREALHPESTKYKPVVHFAGSMALHPAWMQIFIPPRTLLRKLEEVVRATCRNYGKIKLRSPLKEYKGCRGAVRKSFPTKAATFLT